MAESKSVELALHWFVAAQKGFFRVPDFLLPVASSNNTCHHNSIVVYLYFHIERLLCNRNL